MNKEFCMSCGQKNVFEVTRPKFCCGCGQPLNTLSVASTPTQRRIVKDDQEEESDFDIESIDIDRLRKQISYEGQARKVSLDDLWKAPAPSDGVRRVGVSGPQGKDLLAQIKKECSPVTTPKEIE